MKEFLQNFSQNADAKFVKPFKEKFFGFVTKHPEVFCLTLLAVLCLLFLFYGLNFYPLLDVDETRYAIMSRDLLHSADWNSLMLNAVPFLEKPPLYFWLVAGSIKLFGGFTEFAVRLPIAVLASFITFFTYFLGKKVISRKFGMISALILLSSIFFLILSHIAILDMVLTVFVTAAIYCGFLTHFCEEKNKKYFWWYFYLFAALGFLAKGILALAIPAVVIFAYNFVTKTAKDIFKPVNLIPGLIIFLIASLPWHVIMYLEYGKEFIKQYFLIHHFARFINSEYIGRERPFWFFIPVFFLGFMPWSFAFVAFIADGFKKLSKKYKTAEGKVLKKLWATLDAQNNEQKLVLFASLYFVIVFLLFSVSSTKLPTYILPVFPAAALLTGFFWWESDEKSEHEKAISVTTQIFAGMFILAAIAGTIAYFYLPENLQSQLAGVKHLAICGLYLLAIFLLLRLNVKRALSVFSAYIFTMFFIIVLGVSFIFTFVYNGGENEIVRFSSYANDGASQLLTFDFAVKPSAMIGYRGNVGFITDPDFGLLRERLKYRGGSTFVIVKNKNLDDKEYSKKINKDLELMVKGERYSLFVNKGSAAAKSLKKQPSCPYSYACGQNPNMDFNAKKAKDAFSKLDKQKK